VSNGAPARRTRLRGLARSAGPTALALALWAGLIVVSHVFGARLVASDPRTVIFAAPLVARFAPHLSPTALIPVAVAAVVLLFAPRLVERLGWRGLLVAAFLGAVVWAAIMKLDAGVQREVLERLEVHLGEALLDPEKPGRMQRAIRALRRAAELLGRSPSVKAYRRLRDETHDPHPSVLFGVRRRH